MELEKWDHGEHPEEMWEHDTMHALRTATTRCWWWSKEFSHATSPKHFRQRRGKRDGPLSLDEILIQFEGSKGPSTTITSYHFYIGNIVVSPDYQVTIRWQGECPVQNLLEELYHRKSDFHWLVGRG